MKFSLNSLYKIGRHFLLTRNTTGSTTCFDHVNQLNLSTSSSLSFPKIAIDGVNLNYVEVGTGSHTLLCLPGTFGFIESDYGTLLKTIDKSKFKVVVWDPPGYGASRPPNRDFSGDYYMRDAILVQKLMQELGHEKYSVLGWSVGGITAALLGWKYPSHVTHLIFLASPSLSDQRIVALSKHLQDLDKWNKAMITPLLQVYGKEYLSSMLKDWAVAQEEIMYTMPDFQKCLQSIKCPALIFQGDADKFLTVDHAHNLHNAISGSKLMIVPKGSHMVHLTHPDLFVNALHDFLLTESK